MSAAHIVFWGAVVLLAALFAWGVATESRRRRAKWVRMTDYPYPVATYQSARHYARVSPDYGYWVEAADNANKAFRRCKIGKITLK